MKGSATRKPASSTNSLTMLPPNELVACAALVKPSYHIVGYDTIIYATLRKSAAVKVRIWWSVLALSSFSLLASTEFGVINRVMVQALS